MVDVLLYKNEYRIFEPVEIIIRKEKIRGDEPIWVIIYIYMEMYQLYTLYSDPKQTKMSFFFYKNKEQEGKTGSAWGVGIGRKGRT
jgi:hypothetical protein